MPTADLADDSVDKAEEEANEPPRRERLPTGFYLVGGLAAAFIAISVALLLLLVNERNDAERLRTEQTNQAAVQSTAAQLVEALVNFRPDSGDARREVVHKLGNGPILSQYDAAVSAFAQAAAAVGITSVESSITETYTGQIAGDEAQVVVVFDVTVKGTQPRNIPNQYMRVHLARIGGVWKVDNVQSVNLALAALAGAGTPDASAPTTTAPPDTSTGG